MTEVTTYRHTDNPATRNDIANWRSTHRVINRTYRVNEDGSVSSAWDELDSGEKWLTSEIEVDPAFDAVPYEYDLRSRVVEELETRFFGDDQSASETTALTTISRAEDAIWNQNQARVDGGHTLYSTTIANGDGQNHSVGGNADGNYTINLGAIQVTVGAEEWLDSIAP